MARARHEGISNAHLSFHCPGCKTWHTVRVLEPHAWDWNGSLDRPTLTPSVKVTWPANPNASEEFKEWRATRICHSFVRDGRIQFLGDCTHDLAGQTVDLPEIEA